MAAFAAPTSLLALKTGALTGAMRPTFTTEPLAPEPDDVLGLLLLALLLLEPQAAIPPASSQPAHTPATAREGAA
jgi:hypothetical protein